MLSARTAGSSALFFALLFVAFLVYQPGLGGGFLFDDFPNLEKLGSYGGVDDWESFRAYVFGGFSGPTGRPLSLLTFLLNDNNWPSDPRSFKTTNLLIHLLCGVMLFWASLRVLIFYGYQRQEAEAAALLSAGLWLLHPMMVSTTLYVVQRMAQLSTLFVLVGITGYLIAREQIGSNRRSSCFWMSLSVGLCTLLATLSKENGALLPMLILAIEFCRPPSMVSKKPVWWRVWQAVFLWLPSLLILLYLASRITLLDDPWPNRPFNQIERVLSEARIIWDYIFHLLVPQIEGRGLYQDAYVVSTGLFTPWVTAPAVVGVLLLVGFSVSARARYPLVCMAILYFFVAHLLESSVVGLELYFEHRNYMAALFLFLPISMAIVMLRHRLRLRTPALISLLIVALLSWMTWQRAELWSDTDRLELYWAYANPDSPRAANAVAAYLVNSGRLDEADDYLEDALARRPDSALLSTRILLQRVYAGVATPEDFSVAAERLMVQPFDAQAVKGMRMLAEYASVQDLNLEYQAQTLSLLDQVNRNDAYRRFPLFIRLTAYLRAMLLLSMGESQAAYDQYVLALDLYGQVDAGMKMVSELGQNSQPALALMLLDKTAELLESQSDTSLTRSRKVYESEIERMREVLKEDLVAPR